MLPIAPAPTATSLTEQIGSPALVSAQYPIATEQVPVPALANMPALEPKKVLLFFSVQPLSKPSAVGVAATGGDTQAKP
jgi:hypothetical protein